MNRCARCSGTLSLFAVFCPHCARAHEPDLDLLIGQTIGGRYRIYRRLENGGLSTVFVATDLESDRIAAIKVSAPAPLVRRDLSYAVNEADARRYWDELLERMRREVETLAAIEHPNIVRFYGTGLINDDLRYAAMEFLRGRTLREEIDDRGLIPPREAAMRSIDVASALSEVHSRGIVHRDINPRNIFLCGDSVKLIDFGIAKFPQPEGAPPFTRHSMMTGTVSYASPEQCQSHSIDHRSDIYSLAIVLYEMITGERPFQGRTPTEVALKQIQSQPISPRALNSSVPAILENAILRALSKNPDDRQQTVDEFAAELRGDDRRISIDLRPVAPLLLPPAPESVEFEYAQAERKPGALSRPIPQAGLNRWGRATFATILLLTVMIGAGLAWDYLSSMSAGKLSQKTPASSPTPTAPGEPGSETDATTSDADPLELDAKLPLPASRPTPAANGPTALQNPRIPTIGSPENRAKSTETISPLRSRPAAPTPAPTLAPPKAKPEPVNKPRPFLQQASRNGERSASETAIAPKSARKEPELSPPSARPAPANQAPAEFNRREPRAFDRPAARTDDEEEKNDEDEDSLEPRMIQWDGMVRGERELKLALPGVPASIEIPKAYRNRVGLVEPPSPDNRWRYAVFRVYGDGPVSFRVRWRPHPGEVRRFSARRD
jgi:eukaryotic-like serine/threonine-protein kinase